MLKHTFEPIYDENSKILILGSFPSVASREVDFYYGHPRNRFWPLIGKLLGENMPETPEEKTAYLKRHHIALYDAVASCDIKGSLDANMKDAVPQVLSPILDTAKIRVVIGNGTKAYDTAEVPEGIPLIKLPSTSPANAAYSMERLLEHWKVILDYLDD